VEEWLDHAECCSKYQESPDWTKPRITDVGRLPSLIQLRRCSRSKFRSHRWQPATTPTST
jgi:hypothetical protein